MNSNSEKLFKKISNLEKKKSDNQKRKLEIEAQASKNKILGEYISIINSIIKNDSEINNYLEELRQLMDNEEKFMLEDKRIQIKITRGYTKTVIDTKLFYEHYKPTSKVYQNVVREKSVKSSIKLYEKETTGGD